MNQPTDNWPPPGRSQFFTPEPGSNILCHVDMLKDGGKVISKFYLKATVHRLVTDDLRYYQILHKMDK